MVKLAYGTFLFIILNTIVFATDCRAESEVVKKLRENGHPIGMFGANWDMTQLEVKKLFKNLSQLDANTLAKKSALYDRPMQATFHFKNDRLNIIVVSFMDNFLSLNEFADDFYKVQQNLSMDYGIMPDPIIYELVPPINGKWTDQKFMRSEKKMGRTTLVHRITIKNNSAGEQIMMYLSSANN